jgi:hypothetical protein
MTNEDYKIEWKDGKSFAAKFGSRETYLWDKKNGLVNCINDEFSKKPTVRANALQQLYLTGRFEEWVDGFGMVQLEDRVARAEYMAGGPETHFYQG